MSTGLIARKVGMSRHFLENGEVVPVTYLQVDPNVIVRTKVESKDGYNAVVLGVRPKEWKTRKGNTLTRYSTQKEWKVDSLEGLEPGKELKADSIPVESMVTISGISKGKGFQGVVKRHGFKGGPRTHGSHFKREPGAIGMRTQPGRVFKGHPMAGHMGLDQITLRHRPVVMTDVENGVIAIKGPIPGPNGGDVYITVESTPTS